MNMADAKLGDKVMETNLDEELQKQMPPWAQGDKLRNVERDILIPKIMRERAKVQCKDLVDEFAQCAKGRTVSIVWNCMSQNNAMKECLAKYYQDPGFFEECKEIYLKDRKTFQKAWMEAEHTKKPQRSEQAIS